MKEKVGLDKLVDTTKRYIDYKFYLVKHKVDVLDNKLHKKLHPQYIFKGHYVSVVPATDAWTGGTADLVSIDGKVKSYGEVSYINNLGRTSINNVGGNWRFWSYSHDKELFGVDLPIYTFTHDGTLYISDDPDLIIKEIKLDCEDRCIIKKRVTEITK